jgi:NAD+ kinase
VSLERIGIVVHEGKPSARAAAETVRRWAAGHDIPAVAVDVWSDRGQRRNARDEAAEAGYPDLIVTIGGDGTFLRGARIAAVVDAPVLGVDVGRVGFLTEVGVEELTAALEAVRNDSAIIAAARDTSRAGHVVALRARAEAAAAAGPPRPAGRGGLGRGT